MLNLSPDQRAEVEKYGRAYAHDSYRMKEPRLLAACQVLYELPHRGSFVDVGCGRGEMLIAARHYGFDPAAGTEVVPALIGGDVVGAVAWDLPFADAAFDVVGLFDVIEHLLAEDGIRTLRELGRVAKRAVIVTAANYPSHSMGDELHVTIRDYSEWAEIIEREIGAARWEPRRFGTRNETWVVEL